MDINISNITQTFSSFLHRYHVIVFVVVVLGALGLGIFIIYQQTLATDLAQGYTAQSNNTSFDSQTSDQIRKLHPSEYRLPPAQPSEERNIVNVGDVNPFVE